jgi:primase-polymerase (primpol)-like protein
MSESIPTDDELPRLLTTRDQWLCWRSEDRDGKMTKVPIDPNSGRYASTTDSSTWSAFETARERVISSPELDGLGFVFTDSDPIVGVDLDACRIPETGKTRDWATDIIDRLDSFTEVSPSGTGYHVLVEGSLPNGRNRKGDVECYETTRFFTVTGEHVDSTPPTIESRANELEAVHLEYLSADEESKDDGNRSPATPSLSDRELIERAKNAANGEKFSRLWRGSTTGYESNSEADMALCSLLAFWTGGDAAQVDRLFRDSGLMREKWDERHFADGSTYGEKTIERAISSTSEFYEPSTSKMRETVEAATSSTLDPNAVRDRENERLHRIEELAAELQTAVDETERLQAELDAERERRHELEAKLEAAQNTETEGSWLPWR